MVRGLVPKERLLEWEVGDGWEPLCKFLGKPVPEVAFPHSNTRDKGWKERETQATNKWFYGALLNFSLITGGVVAVGALLTTIFLRSRLGNDTEARLHG